MLRALVVDDSRAMRVIMGRILKPLGYEIIEASNGVEALARLKEAGDVKLATVDWNMPEMDGLSFVRAVRAEPNYHDITILMVTTETESDRVGEAISAGASEYLMKPFTAEDVKGKLDIIGGGGI
jgi:two-component system chemotaxis response regulator CheY